MAKVQFKREKNNYSQSGNYCLELGVGTIAEHSYEVNQIRYDLLNNSPMVTYYINKRYGKTNTNEICTWGQEYLRSRGNC